MSVSTTILPLGSRVLLSTPGRPAGAMKRLPIRLSRDGRASMTHSPWEFIRRTAPWFVGELRIEQAQTLLSQVIDEMHEADLALVGAPRRIVKTSTPAEHLAQGQAVKPAHQDVPRAPRISRRALQTVGRQLRARRDRSQSHTSMLYACPCL